MQNEDIKKALAEVVDKMPKNKMQANQWCTDFIDDRKDELLKSGLSVFEILGVLERLKQKIIVEVDKADDIVKKLLEE